MINEKDIIADLHTHSIHSDHAYSTIYENVTANGNPNLKFIANTDHFFNDGTEVNKNNEVVYLRYIKETCNFDKGSPSIISGAEFNINQKIECNSHNFMKRMRGISWKIIGTHSWFLDIPETDINDVFDIFIKSAEEIKASGFCHIERELTRFKNHNEENVKELMFALVDYAVRNNIYLEINESSILQGNNNLERMKIWIPYANEKKANFYMGSDAHFCKRVGKFDNILEIINDVGIPKERILNHICNYDLLEKINP